MIADGTIDVRDLANSLRRVCYEDRARVYDSTLHELDVHGRLETVQKLLEKARPGFPTMIPRKAAGKAASAEAIHWLIEHNVIVARSEEHYGLLDEFLRIRIIMDGQESEAARAKAEQSLIDRLYRHGRIIAAQYEDQ